MNRHVLNYHVVFIVHFRCRYLPESKGTRLEEIALLFEDVNWGRSGRGGNCIEILSGRCVNFYPSFSSRAPCPNFLFHIFLMASLRRQLTISSYRFSQVLGYDDASMS